MARPSIRAMPVKHTRARATAPASIATPMPDESRPRPTKYMVVARPLEKTTVSPFARGASFYSILLLFFIGGVAGDLAETIFCRLKMGWWMSRSSVVWGPFSIVWGLALAAATLFLYKYRDRSASFFFVAGTLLGGLYEYLCSVFTELVFGTVFWDYSAIPFNLGGRINLLYCFFWGFAAVDGIERIRV